MQARALWIVGPTEAEVRAETLRAPGEGEVHVEALFSGVSRGTERLVFEGRVPPSQRATMRAPFQEGSFPWPVKHGYQSVGVVEGVGTVFCLFPHQDRYVVPADAVVALPPGVPAERAVLGGNAETALNAVWDAGIGPGDRVAVVGAGVVGCLVAWLAARIPGTEVHIHDIRPEREAVAAALGVGWGGQPERDVVVHASGTAAGLAHALALAATEATVVELSWYGDRAVPAPLGEAFHARRLTLRGSQVGSVPPGRAPRWTRRRRLEKALALLDDPCLDVLIDGEGPLEGLPEVLAGAGLCHRVRYGSPRHLP